MGRNASALEANPDSQAIPKGKVTLQGGILWEKRPRHPPLSRHTFPFSMNGLVTLFIRGGR